MTASAFVAQQQRRTRLRQELGDRLEKYPWGEPRGQTCTRCVMDGSATEIHLAPTGCSFCLAERRLAADVAGPPPPRDARTVLGISGGVDSSFAALAAVRDGHKPLLLHVDNNWSSSVGTSNVLAVARGLDLDLVTLVVDWHAFRAVQLALFRAGVIDVEMITDHVYIAGVVRGGLARRRHWFITGQNMATERILPRSWTHRKTDLTQLKHVLQVGGGPPDALSRLPTLGSVAYETLRQTRVVRTHRILDVLAYSRSSAIADLTAELGWAPYAMKHGESTFTSIYQSVYLPLRFGVDKRRAHFSSEILAGAVTRAEALSALERPPLPPTQAVIDTEFVCDKLGTDLEELLAWLDAPSRSHSELRGDHARMEQLKALRSYATAVSGRLRKLLR